MMRFSVARSFLAVVCAAAALGVVSVRAELLSKRYLFKPGVILEISAPAGSGLMLDTVRFEIPPTGASPAEAEPPGARVTVTNLSARARKVGLAIALFDDQERLLGVASGGSKMAGIKPNRQKSFSLSFGGVFTETARATTFQISLEPRD